MVHKISVHERLNILEKRNNRLKSLLLHEQLKYGNYSYKHLEEKILLILNEYKNNNSLVKSAKIAGINSDLAVKWFVEGQKGNSNFKILYSGIKRFNGFEFLEEEMDSLVEDEIDVPLEKDYKIEHIGNSWVYTTDVDGNKLSIISSDLDHLKEKISDKNLPL